MLASAAPARPAPGGALPPEVVAAIAVLNAYTRDQQAAAATAAPVETAMARTPSVQ